MSKQAIPRNVATLLNRAKLRNVATLLNRAKLEYLSLIVFHTILRTHSLATRTVWNTIDDRNSSFALLSNVVTFLGFARGLVNSKFGVIYSNFLNLTPTFWKGPIQRYGKTPNFS